MVLPLHAQIEEIMQERNDLEIKYQSMITVVIELTEQVDIRENKLNKINDIITGKVKHPHNGLVMAEYELEEIEKILDN